MSSFKVIEEGGGGDWPSLEAKKKQQQKRNKENKPGPAQVITCRQVVFFRDRKSGRTAKVKRLSRYTKTQDA